jgi:hypothetical protein
MHDPADFLAVCRVFALAEVDSNKRHGVSFRWVELGPLADRKAGGQ